MTVLLGRRVGVNVGELTGVQVGGKTGARDVSVGLGGGGCVGSSARVAMPGSGVDTRKGLGTRPGEANTAATTAALRQVPMTSSTDRALRQDPNSGVPGLDVDTGRASYIF